MKPTNRKNRTTGQLRKWICFHHGIADGLLEAAEVMATYPRHKGRYYTRMPLEVCEQLATELEATAAGLRLEADRKGELTEVEIRYCALEGIEHSEYLKAKSGNSARKA